MTDHQSAYGDPLNLSRKLPPHPTDRHEVKRSMIRAVALLALGLLIFALVTP